MYAFSPKNSAYRIMTSADLALVKYFGGADPALELTVRRRLDNMLAGKFDSQSSVRTVSHDCSGQTCAPMVAHGFRWCINREGDATCALSNVSVAMYLARNHGAPPVNPAEILGAGSLPADLADRYAEEVRAWCGGAEYQAAVAEYIKRTEAECDSRKKGLAQHRARVDNAAYDIMNTMIAYRTRGHMSGRGVLSDIKASDFKSLNEQAVTLMAECDRHDAEVTKVDAIDKLVALLNDCSAMWFRNAQQFAAQEVAAQELAAQKAAQKAAPEPAIAVLSDIVAMLGRLIELLPAQLE